MRRLGWLLLGVAALVLGVPLGLALLVVALFSRATSPPAATAGSALARSALWWPVVQAAVRQPGLPAPVPPALALAVIVHESGGNPAALDRDANGTVDAGLMQLNSGPDGSAWRAAGLWPWPKPLDPRLNVAAGVRHLARNLASYPGDPTAALYAYNGGTAANGARFDPRYAPAVLAAAAQLAQPVLWAWPAGAPPAAGATRLTAAGPRATLLLVAWQPVGPTLVRPAVVTVNGAPATWTLGPAGGLQAGQGAWEATVPWPAAGRTAPLTLRAVWPDGATVTVVGLAAGCAGAGCAHASGGVPLPASAAPPAAAIPSAPAPVAGRHLTAGGLRP